MNVVRSLCCRRCCRRFYCCCSNTLVFYPFDVYGAREEIETESRGLICRRIRLELQENEEKFAVLFNTDMSEKHTHQTVWNVEDKSRKREGEGERASEKGTNLKIGTHTEKFPAIA